MITKFSLNITGLSLTIETDDASSAPATPDANAIIDALRAQLAAQLLTPVTQQTSASPTPTPTAVHTNGDQLTPHRPGRAQRAPGRAAAPTPAPEPQTPDPVTNEQPIAPAEPITITTNGTRKATPDDAGDAPIAEPPKAKRTILDFHDFDTLVREEMARLAPEPGVMPGHAIWNERRQPPLPTLTAVYMRYGCDNPRSLAEKLGMRPPLTSKAVKETA